MPNGVSGREGEKAGIGNPSCPEDRSTGFACYLQSGWQRLDVFNGSLRVEATVPIDGFENRIDFSRPLVIVAVGRPRWVVRTLHVREKQSPIEGKADVLAGHCQHPMVYQRDEPSAHRSSLADRNARVKASSRGFA